MKFKPIEILTHVILILGVLLMVLPIWFSFATSTHDNIEIMTGGMKFF
jgi:sn-glycerol 3-phosphate transport system permease protein